MSSIFEEAIEVRNPIIPNNKRRRTLQTPDGSIFIGKNNYCKKTKANTNWLVNEIIAAEYAKASQVRVPNIRLLSCNNTAYLGSHFISNRMALTDGEISKRCTESEIPHLIRALLLDLALLNSDRTAGNTLCDESGLLWFYDYDKSLWGDGKELPSGDLYRLDTSIIEVKFEAYLGDFLCYQEANKIAFIEDRDNQITENFDSLKLTLEPLNQSIANIPSEWMNEDLIRRLAVFLPLWWERLRIFFDNSNGPSRLRTILRQRSKF